MMTRVGKLGRKLLLGGFLAIGIATAPAARAQSCALCYQSASAAGPRAIRALRNGILILIFPPAMICAGMTYLVYRRRNSHNEN